MIKVKNPLPARQRRKNQRFFKEKPVNNISNSPN
jgi:hypothetical protein